MQRRRTLLQSDNNGRGYIGDYEYVDFGLPSGTLWATCNVGATDEFSVGDTKPWFQDGYDQIIYNSMQTELPTEYDSACSIRGSGWRTPSYDQVLELKENITRGTLIEKDGLYGIKWISKKDPNKYIIFPCYTDDDIGRSKGEAAFWTRTLTGPHREYGYVASAGYKYDSDMIFQIGSDYVDYRCYIRPVYNGQ